MLHHTALTSISKPVNQGAAFVSLAMIDCTPEAEMVKTVDVNFCGSANTLSTDRIKAYYGIFGV